MRNGKTRTMGLLLVLLVALVGSGAFAAYAQSDKPFPPADGPVTRNPDSPDTIALPDSGTVTTSGTAWQVTNSGTGRAGLFYLYNKNTSSPALEARTISTSSNATAFTALAMGTLAGTNSAAIRATNYSTSTKGYAIYAQHNGAGTAVYASTSGAGYGVYGVSLYTGVYGRGPNSGVWGAGGAYGVYGNGNVGVQGESLYVGVWGIGRNVGTVGQSINIGVSGIGGAIGVRGTTDDANGVGVQGNATASGGYGVRGSSTSYVGVRGDGNDTGVWAVGGTYGLYGQGHIGVYGKGDGTSGTLAGYFAGKVTVTGGCCTSPLLVTRNDHPLDAAKYVDQVSVISPEQLGVYNGNSTLDGKGEAVVSLPAWFGAMYTDYRYSLTALDAAAPNLHVTDRSKNVSFRIAGGVPGMQVSWQVSGIRQDKYAKEHPLQVEGLKATDPAASMPEHDAAKP